MTNKYLSRLGALAALSALLVSTACTSIEPLPAPVEPGDKAWSYVHPWYNTSWSGGAKAAYWIGPGH